MELSEKDLKNLKQRGERAAEIYNSPIFQEALITLKGDMLLEFQDTNLDSDKARLNAWQKAQVVKDFEKKFIKIMRVGSNANLTLMERAKKLLRI